MRLEGIRRRDGSHIPAPAVKKGGDVNCPALSLSELDKNGFLIMRLFTFRHNGQGSRYRSRNIVRRHKRYGTRTVYVNSLSKCI